MKVLIISILALTIVYPVFGSEYGENQSAECKKSIHMSREQVADIQKASSSEESSEKPEGSQTASK